jgi:GDP/UDP-N,N'-diacetylbacillosamine 2-epimerase (hydrolysing)
MNKKICVITGTRAEYGLLYWTLKQIQEAQDFDLQLCVTGMHLAPEFGLTYQQIEKDGFFINEKIEILLSSDTSVGVSKSIGLGVIGFSEAFQRLKPDMILMLGDRFEIFSAAAAAMVCKIPIAHCHGGEATEGLIDESIRHSITKMSQLHFTSTEEYRNRVIQLGENPNRVFNVGALGIENINQLQLMDKSATENSINFKIAKNNILVTFHPVTLEDATAENQFLELLEAIDSLQDTYIIFTKPNADTDGRIIISLIDQYVATHSNKSVAFISLGQLRYLSLLQHVDMVVGNSSSGLIEVPSFKIPTINIGDRQRGRLKSKSVIDCEPTKDSIIKAFEVAKSTSFKKSLDSLENLYGTGNSSYKIMTVLRNIDIKGILKKKFYNLTDVCE